MSQYDSMPLCFLYSLLFEEASKQVMLSLKVERLEKKPACDCMPAVARGNEGTKFIHISAYIFNLGLDEHVCVSGRLKYTFYIWCRHLFICMA